MTLFLTPEWPAPARIKAFTTLRQGWGQSNTKSPEERHKLCRLLDLPNDPIWLKQTHSTTVIQATNENKDQTADAAFTHQPNCVCVVITADCMPILICNKQGTQVAAIHAGWRGLAAGIIDATLQALGQPASDLIVWLGPTIGPEKFEVGKDVYDAFTVPHPESAAAFTPLQTDKWLANLYDLARMRLLERGISAIYGGNFCTHTQADLFFSYRRDKDKAGRMASLIWIS